MSRLGPWNPTTIEDRLDRMESLASIRQLPYRYAVAVDSRDMDMMVDLFVPDVRVGKDEIGRESLKRWFTDTLSKTKSSCHFVGNHIVDFDDADRARGIVYCHDELEHPTKDEWAQGQLQYWDTYRRVDGEWCFERRRFHRLYICDWLTRPSHGASAEADTAVLSTHQLPEAYPSWHAYWEGMGATDG
ncbi:MAG TPA: nuclear transport factor 2 family protein [Acidimicrobiales bacterium]|nr:nuclear transport factor 2 family protein [Acidimicrobiales bacterium]